MIERQQRELGGFYMGVDACIEVIPEEAISEEKLHYLSGCLAECIGSENFWIKPEEGQHVLSINDEGYVQVNTFWRYYGEGYERGPWMEIRYTLLWLIKHIPGKVYYYGDNSEREYNEVTETFLKKMDEYFIQ